MVLQKLVKQDLFKPMLFFIMALAVFNIAFIHSAGWVRLLWNIAGYLSLILVYKAAKLKPDDIGLSLDSVKKGIKYSAISVLAIVTVLVVAFLFDKNAFHDSRYHHSFSTALFAALVLLPLKTVLFEEIAFRGILLALFLQFKKSRLFATIASSLLFGAWHIISATKIGGQYPDPNLIVVLGVFILTSAAGLIFCWLRWHSGSLIASIAAHWAINATAIILASLSWPD